MIDGDAVLANKRVLIVEDEMLIAMLIEDMLVDLGCEPVGPYSSVAGALGAMDSHRFDLAILDANLGREMIYPVAERLEQRGIPFLLVSGYGQQAVPAGRDHWRVCTKPFRRDDLVRMMVSLVPLTSQ